MPNDVASNVALGVLGSFIASILFLGVLFIRRPKLRVSDAIARTTLEGKTIHCVKVINQGWFDVINLRAELVLVQPDRVVGGIARRINPFPLAKDCLFVLRSPRTAGAESSFAFRFVTESDIAGEWERQEGLWKQSHSNDPALRPYVHFVVYGQDGLLNFGRVFDKVYSSSYHDLQTGEFMHGLSMDINAIPTDRGDDA